MMRKYEALTDAELLAKITKFRDALEQAAIGGDVTVIAGEGRRMEVTKGNTALAENLLDGYEREWAIRYPSQSYGKAISVSITQ